jgi:multidrug efflux pump subunit AcrB
VRKKVDPFNHSQFEAVLLAIVVLLIGFWEWGSALLMAISIPVTLARTFGFMQRLFLDIQQMSIASLIIALGLPVDNPVVAGDALKQEPGSGWPGSRRRSSTLPSPMLLPSLPLLLLRGDVGRYIYSMPVTICLFAGRLAPGFHDLHSALAFYLLRAKAEPAATRLRWYSRAAGFAIDQRGKVLAVFSVLLVLGGYFARALHHQFFPRGNFEIAHVDIRLAAPLEATEQAVREPEAVVEEEARSATVEGSRCWLG